MSPCELDLRLSYPKMYTAVLQVIIYQRAKYERSDEKWQRNRRTQLVEKKKKNNKEKTIQQQKGLPTLSADLN